MYAKGELTNNARPLILGAKGNITILAGGLLYWALFKNSDESKAKTTNLKVLRTKYQTIDYILHLHQFCSNSWQMKLTFFDPYKSKN